MRPVQGGIEGSGFGDGGGHDDDDGETANRSVVMGPYGLVRRRQREKKQENYAEARPRVCGRTGGAKKTTTMKGKWGIFI
jgi:hypothetical protein